MPPVAAPKDHPRNKGKPQSTFSELLNDAISKNLAHFSESRSKTGLHRPCIDQKQARPQRARSPMCQYGPVRGPSRWAWIRERAFSCSTSMQARLATAWRAWNTLYIKTPEERLTASQGDCLPESAARGGQKKKFSRPVKDFAGETRVLE